MGARLEFLLDIVEDNQNKNLLLIGNFTSKIANEQNLLRELLDTNTLINSTRKFKVNGKSRKLMDFCDIFNFIVLNRG